MPCSDLPKNIDQIINQRAVAQAVNQRLKPYRHQWQRGYDYDLLIKEWKEKGI